jgi:hypothetical protein
MYFLQAYWPIVKGTDPYQWQTLHNIPDMRRRLPVLRLFLVRLSSPWHSLNKDIRIKKTKEIQNLNFIKHTTSIQYFEKFKIQIQNPNPTAV